MPGMSGGCGLRFLSNTITIRKYIPANSGSPRACPVITTICSCSGQDLIDVSDYFALLAKEIRNYETMPGRQIRSAELASFDTWIKQYKPDENSINSTVSYYRKGALVGFVTDMSIRRETDNRASLDDVMREMYARYGPEATVRRGYPTGAFEDMVESTAGTGVRKIVEDMLRTTNDLAVDEALEWYGLILNRDLDRTSAENNGHLTPTGFGVSWDTSGPLLLVGRGDQR